MAVPLLPRLKSYAEPLVLLSISVFFLPVTLVLHPILAITSPSTFRSKWFEAFWRVIGPKMAASPLQVDHIEILASRCYGTVLELGPGAGDQCYHFKPAQITRVYGAEPNKFLHPRLLEQAAAAGFEKGKYMAIECGAEPGSLLPALKKAGLVPSTMSSLPEEGIFDTIIAIKSLCSVDKSQLPTILAIIQALLKPGGEFLFFEHVANNTDSMTMILGRFIDLAWPHFMGGCHITNALDVKVNSMGGWRRREIKNAGNFLGHEPFRYVRGLCQK